MTILIAASATVADGLKVNALRIPAAARIPKKNTVSFVASYATRMGRKGDPMKTLAAIFALSIACAAQLPNAPSVVCCSTQPERVKLALPADVKTDTYHGKSFALISIAAYGTTVLDIESTRHGIESCGLREANPLMGPNPGRAKLYAFGMATTTGYVLVGNWIRKKNPRANAWWSRVFPATPLAIHGYAAVHNYSICGR